MKTKGERLLKVDFKDKTKSTNLDRINKQAAMLINSIDALKEPNEQSLKATYIDQSIMNIVNGVNWANLADKE